MRRSALAVLSFVVACGQPARPSEPKVVAPPDAVPEDLVIGQIVELTGPGAVFAISIDRGVQQAILDRNALGGINGAQVRLITLDDAGKPAEAEAAVPRLIAEGAKVIVGGLRTATALAAAIAAQDAGVPMIVPASLNPALDEVGDLVFTMTGDGLARPAARFAFDTLHARTAAVLVDASSVYDTRLAVQFEDQFVALGGTMHGKAHHAAGRVDKKVLARLAGADVIYLPAYASEVGPIVQAARAAGVVAPFLGSEGWAAPDLDTTTLDGSYYLTQFSPLENRESVATFVRAFEDRHGVEPDILAALGYDATRVLLDAIRRAPSLSAGDLRDALRAPSDFGGVTGAIVLGFAGGAPTFATRVVAP